MYFMFYGVLVFFFFKQKTAYEMRISDWSSDVCSSDLTGDASAFPGGDGFAQGVVEIVGPDLDRSLDFYLLLGFELLRRSEGFAVVHWQGQRLFLAENPDAPTTPRWTN